MFTLAARSFRNASETFVRAHAERIAPGQSAYVCFDDAPDDPLPGPLLYKANTWPRITGSTQRPALPFTGLVALRTRVVASFLKRNDVGIMLAEFGPFGYRLLPAAERAGARHFVHFHGWDASRVLSDARILRKYRMLWDRAAGFFAPSRFIADRLIAVGCPASAIEVTPCGVDPENFPLSRREPGRALAVGRFVDKKAPEVTVAAFAAAAARHPEARLDFVGDGPRLEACRKIAEEHGLAERITFHGVLPHDEVRRLMARASIFLQHSVTAPSGDTEGLPVAILEAMSAGHCVISTRHSGIPEAVIEGESGLLTDEHDAAAMTAAIDRALADPDWAAGLGDAARSRVAERFSMDRSVGILRERMGL